jgi:NAD(P)-dependent dehydrogenase (short-subunit alcohol dehydrogenase family)
MQRINGLQDKRVVVLGGSSGIGLEVAKQAASQGVPTNNSIIMKNPRRLLRKETMESESVPRKQDESLGRVVIARETCWPIGR